MKKRVLIDFDDTVLEFSRPFVENANRLYNTNVRVEDIDTWDIENHYPHVSKEALWSILHSERIFRFLKPFDDVIEALKYLNDNFDVCFVTAAVSHPFTVVDRIENIRENLPFIDTSKQLVWTKNKTWCATPGSILIDDGVHNLVAHENVGGVSICFDRPNNQQWKGLRAGNWTEVLNLIHNLEQ